MDIIQKRIDLLNNKMLNQVQKNGYLKSPRYLNSFKTVKRHLFTPSIFEMNKNIWEELMVNYDNPQTDILEKIYVDRPLVVALKEDDVLTTSSQPSVMAMMAEAANIVSGMRVLEVGTGSGYNAAVLAEITNNQDNIVTMEIDRQIFNFAKENLIRAGYKKILIINKDGGFSEPVHAPYDSIIVTCAATDISKRWIDQLKIQGTIVVPLATKGVEVLFLIKKVDDNEMVGTPITYVRFLRLQGISSMINHYHLESKKFHSFERLIKNEAKFDKTLNEMFSQNFHRKKLLDFVFYLSLTENDMVTYEDVSDEKLGMGYGIWKKDTHSGGLILVFPGRVIHYGSEEVKNLMMRHVEEFHAMGNPTLNKYSIEITSAFKPLEKKHNIYWNIKRRNLNTIFILNK
ncbi:MAG TPA: protein-L-isoaspartate O-methyltransferase [Firmicutes bacterium]|nr:protein-L-isoaspartate O-methyltransferase [Bacillota bacterium]